MKELLLKLAYYILQKYRIRFFIVPSDSLTKVVENAVDSVQSKFGDQSGEFKRHQVLRSVSNILPEAKESEVALAIEIYMSEKKMRKDV